MKKVVVTIISIAVIGFLVLCWHIQEEKARGRYKTESLIIMDKAYSKQIENGWTEKQRRDYADSLKKAKGIKYPVMCPVCYYKYLKYRYYEK